MNKPEGITILETSVPEVQGSPFTTQELLTAEDENRTAYTTEDTIAVYVFFANGVSSNDTDISVTLGTAYLNTSIVIYEKTLLVFHFSQFVICNYFMQSRQQMQFLRKHL